LQSTVRSAVPRTASYQQKNNDSGGVIQHVLSTLRTIAIVVVGLFLGSVAATRIAPDPTGLLGMTATATITVVFSYAAYRLEGYFYSDARTTE